MSDEQDVRKMGGMLQLIPFTCATMLIATNYNIVRILCNLTCSIPIGSLALVGFVFLAGFYSEDVILVVGYSRTQKDISRRT